MSIGVSYAQASLYLPISIPAGTRIAARGQSGYTAAAVVNINIVGVTKGFLLQSYQRSTTYGADTVNTEGTELAVDGTVHTKGAYTEIVSATTSEIKYLIVDLHWSKLPTSATRSFLIDIAVGGEGSEQDFITNLVARATSHETILPTTFCVPVSIPAGSRLSARAQQSTNTAGYTMHLTLHGLS